MKQLYTGFSHPAFLVENLSELPRLSGSKLFCDLETTSGDPKKKSISPWRDCRVAGIAIRSDGSPSFYIPVRHNKPYERYNLEIPNVQQWLRDIFAAHPIWVNQNIKYDRHALFNDWGIDFNGKCVCTIHSRAKLCNSERMYSGGYGLDVLAKQDLDKDIKPLEEALKPYLKDSQDYGDIHPLVLAPYACEDVNTCAQLEDLYPHEPIEELETEVTQALILMEREGVRVRPFDIEKEKLMVELQMYGIQNRMFEQTGRWLNPSSQDDLEEAMLNIFGLPVLKWTEPGDEENTSFKPSPSFSKDVMNDYLDLDLDDDVKWFIENAVQFRSLKTYNGLFLQAYAEKNIQGILHAWYNQTIATGRMSCSNPNLTQCDMRAKALVVPDEGESIARYDYSQIEFRIISEYIRFFDFWMRNPDADFYDGISAQAGCERKPSKVLALGSGYGMGKPKLVKGLKKIKSVQNQVKEKFAGDFWFSRMDVDSYTVAIGREIEKHCAKIYDDFHGNMPMMKKTFYTAQDVAKRLGYVKTMLGRKRHLVDTEKYPATRKAFNAACQGSAADLIKKKIVEFVNLLNRAGKPVKLVLQVHDELVFKGPTEIIEDPRFSRDVLGIMEDNPLPMKIPIRARGGYSSKSWKDACWEKEKEISIPLGERGERFSWL